MARVAIATALGGIVLFVWGLVFWAVLPYSSQVVRPLPNEDLVVDSLRQTLRESGAYVFPAQPRDADPDDPLGPPALYDEGEWKVRHRKGPVGVLLYNVAGTEPMSPHMFILGMTLNLGIAFLSALLLYAAALRKYAGRVTFVFALGIFAALSTHLKQANWMHYPWDYTQLMCVDLVAGNLCMALIVAAVVKPVESV